MFFENKKYFLVSDVGGTKTNIAIIDTNGNILFKKIYVSSEITHFTDTLIQFLHLPECKKYKVMEACIAVAGPLNSERNYARLTNLDLTIDSNNILVRTHLRKVLLLNDFEALGFSIITLKPETFTELTNLGTNDKGTIAIIGAGTGLGVSIVPYAKGLRIPILSEGGHVDLPISTKDKTDLKLQSYFMQKKFYTSAEDMISGRGIVNIYKFLLTQNLKHSKKIQSEISKTCDAEKPALITKCALEDKDTLCIQVLELFIKYYARVSRNLALTTVCSELILAGGIAPKILPALQDVFVDEFVQHDDENMRKILEEIPIIVLVNPDVSLYGALNALKT
jgi:glucokinase